MDLDDRETVVTGLFLHAFLFLFFLSLSSSPSHLTGLQIQPASATVAPRSPRDAGERIIVMTKLALKLVQAAKDKNKTQFVTLVRELKPVLFAWKESVRAGASQDAAFAECCEAVEKGLGDLLNMCKQALSPSAIEFHRQEATRLAKLLAQTIQQWKAAHKKLEVSASSSLALDDRETMAPVTTPSPPNNASSARAKPRARRQPQADKSSLTATSAPTRNEAISVKTTTTTTPTHEKDSDDQGREILRSTMLKGDYMDLEEPEPVDQMNTLANSVLALLKRGNVTAAQRQLYVLLENAKMFCLMSVQQAKKDAYFQSLMDLYSLSTEIACLAAGAELDDRINRMATAIGSLIEETNDLSLFKTDSDNLLADVVMSTIETNLWDERERDPELIHFSGSSIRCASINQLIYKVTDSDSTDGNFLNVFLATFPSFLDPESLFRKLQERHQVPSKYRDRQNVIQARVYNFLTRWMQRSFEDWSQELLESCTQWIDNSCRDKFGEKIKAQIAKAIQATNVQFLHAVEEEFALQESSDFYNEAKFLKLKAVQISEQLCLACSRVFKSVSMREIVAGDWVQEATRKRAASVAEMSALFHAICNLVQSSLVTTESLRERQKLLRKWIRILTLLLSMHNYDACMALLAAFRSPCVNRLKFTWSSIPAKEMAELRRIQDVLDSQSNYERLRNLMKGALVSGSDGGAPAVVPYLGVLLTDVVFVLEGSPDFIGSGQLVNWKKREQLAASLDAIAAFQKGVYTFDKIEGASNFLRRIPVVSDDQLFKLSLEREPRNAEKGELIQ